MNLLRKDKIKREHYIFVMHTILVDPISLTAHSQLKMMNKSEALAFLYQLDTNLKIQPHSCIKLNYKVVSHTAIKGK